MNEIDKLFITIGIDVGGTFTDFVLFLPATGQLETLKIPTTPENPALAVIEGLHQILRTVNQDDHLANYRLQLVHGSTVATNALLERKGARCALITTRGFRDVLEIGRQNRKKLYDLLEPPASPIIPRESRYEINERVLHSGEVLIPLNREEATTLVDRIPSKKIESVAVCLLFSFLFPEHEKYLADLLESHGYFVSRSSEVLPEYREFERTVATAINAYVSPVLDRYLSSLQEALTGLPAEVSIHVMQSNGGAISVAEAKRTGVKCILSGPAGGVSGANFIARLAQRSLWRSPEWVDGKELKVITFDMGGTSTDVSVIDERPIITLDAEVAGHPIRLPMLAIHTVGAGGGSIAWVDTGGVLHVGPQSAGAYPGPACYGHGNPENDQPTVTDANLVLGRISPNLFLGGKMPLDRSRALRVYERLGDLLGLRAIQAASGVIEIINSHMERALRVISLEKGYDPRDFTLISFGGAGGLHAVDLASRLGISRVIVPPLASTLSAFGMIVSDIIKDYSQTVMMIDEIDISDVQKALLRLAIVAETDLRGEGFEPEKVVLEQMLDLRYQGQSYEISIPFSENYIEDFHSAHDRLYGYRRNSAPVEIVNVRVRAIGLISPPELPKYSLSGIDSSHAFMGNLDVYLKDELVPVPCYRAEALLPGNRISGPALIIRSDTTVLLRPETSVHIDEYLNLVISI